MGLHFSTEELKSIGLKSFGENVMIDRTCRFYGAEHIALGSTVRIDAFCVLSASRAGITIGDYVHISTGVAMLGTGGVTIEDFVSVSARVCIFSSSEDSSGTMSGPLVPNRFRSTKSAPVVIRRHVAIGAGSVLLPGIEIGIGAGIGALTLVRHSVAESTVVVGNPMRKIGKRGRQMLEWESEVRGQVQGLGHAS